MIRKKSYKLKLKEWAEMSDLQQRISKAAEENNPVLVAELILQIIKKVTKKNFSNKYWKDSADEYFKIQMENIPSNTFPLMQSQEKSKPLPWEYDGRAWYFWFNLFAKNYGWAEEQIANMEVNDAIGLYQEILVAEQLRQEWEWGLSEVSYSYDKATKKSKPIKLPRPDWMSGLIQKMKQAPQTIKIHKSLMPVGNIKDLGDVKNEKN